MRATQAAINAIGAGAREFIIAHRLSGSNTPQSGRQALVCGHFSPVSLKTEPQWATYAELYACLCSQSAIKKRMPCCNKATGIAAGFWVGGFSLPMDSPVWHNQVNFSVTPEKVSDGRRKVVSLPTLSLEEKFHE
jgi:hypothetical protein